MTVLETTRLRLAAPPDNRRGQLDGATWRFALPEAAASGCWLAPTASSAHDVATMSRHCRLEVTQDRGSLADGVDLVFVDADPMPVVPAAGRTVVRRRDAAAATGLTLVHRDGQLRGVVAGADTIARERLDSLLGPVPHRRRSRSSEHGLDVLHPGAGSLTAPPAWVRSVAAAAGHPVDDHRWLLWCRGDYGSQKLVMFLLAPRDHRVDAVVKITRQPEFNDRLRTEATVLQHLDAAGLGDGRLPRIIASGEHWGSTFCIESAVNGTPVRSADRAMHARLVDDGAAWLTRLGVSTARPASPRDVAPVLDDLVANCVRTVGLDAAHGRFLHEQVRRLADLDSFPVVVQHGDPGVWNAISRGDGTVGFLDWEAGEEHGMPLWDLVYFLRSAVLLVRPARRWEKTLGAVRRHLVQGSPMTAMVAERLDQARRQLELPAQALEPLVHLCWAHRALKEATRRAPDASASGHYARLLVTCIERRDDPGFRRLVGAGR